MSANFQGYGTQYATFLLKGLWVKHITTQAYSVAQSVIKREMSVWSGAIDVKRV